MRLANFRENIHLLLKLKESLIPQADGNFIKDWEVEARKYQYTSENILMQLKEIRFTEGFVNAITSQLYYLRESLSNYDFMPDSEKDKFKRLYVLAALGLIAKLKLILFFSTYINSNTGENYVNDFNLNDSCDSSNSSSNDHNKNCGNEEHAKCNDFDKNRKCTSIICANNSGHNLNNNDSTNNNMTNRVQEKLKIYHDYNLYSNQNNCESSINEENNQNQSGATMNTNTVYRNHMSQYAPYLTQYATNTPVDANMHDYMTQLDMKEVDHLQHENLLDAKNPNTTNEHITKNAVTSDLKDGFLVCQQPPLDTMNAYYGNEQMNSFEDSKLSNVYAYDSKKTETESAARQIYEILTQMQPGYRTSSSSESSNSFSGNNTIPPSYNANFYVPSSMYYQPDNEITDFRQMAHCFQIANISDNMFGSSTYY